MLRLYREEFAARSRVAYERAGAIVVLADTSAVAAKLRQLAPRIVARIVKSAPEITSMRVEVQITQSNKPPAESASDDRLPWAGQPA